MYEDLILFDYLKNATFFFPTACDTGSYGYNCSQKCLCAYGTCNSNATSANESCSCISTYARPFCSRRIDFCGKNKVYDQEPFLLKIKLLRCELI